MALVDLVDRLNLANVDTLVASACVQMPSLPAVSALQAKTGIPTLSHLSRRSSNAGGARLRRAYAWIWRTLQ